jgi:hypothetical protein
MPRPPISLTMIRALVKAKERFATFLQSDGYIIYEGWIPRD